MWNPNAGMFLLNNIYLSNSWQFLKIILTNTILILSSDILDYRHLFHVKIFHKGQI